MGKVPTVIHITSGIKTVIRIKSITQIVMHIASVFKTVIQITSVIQNVIRYFNDHKATTPYRIFSETPHQQNFFVWFIVVDV